MKGWVAVYADEEDWWGAKGLKTDLGTRYATSMYLIFNGLENGFTNSEKYFAIFSELIVSSLIYGGMAALMTESLTGPRYCCYDAAAMRPTLLLL
eukprot:COSAG05_NODE_3659_length_1923_cov_563.266447_1_plen_95_part_00